MPFGVMGQVGPKNHLLDVGPDPPRKEATSEGRGGVTNRGNVALAM